MNDADYVRKSELPTIPTIPTVPTNVSAFVNDADYVRKSELPTIPTIPTVPTNVSAFVNDANYVKKSELPTIPTIPTVPTNVSAFVNDADYVKKSELPTIPEIPTIPTKVSAFTNDARYITAEDIPTIPTVPTKVSAFVNDVDYVRKSELPTIPEIPTIPTKVSAFTNDARYITAADIPAIPTVPTKVSAFTNDANYVKKADLPTVPTKVSAFENDATYVSQENLNALLSEINKRIEVLEQLKKQNQLIDENDDHEQIGDDVVEYVDFGLPSGNLWAKCNLGADSPDKYGNYYSWGELGIRTNYDKTTYSYYDKDEKKYTKYNDIDGLTILEPCDDVVTLLYGAPWAIPSQTDWEELISYGYWVYTSNYNNTNKAGYIVYRAKSEDDYGKRGNSKLTYDVKDAHIFLPNAGWITGTERNYVGKVGGYWTSWLQQSNIEYAKELNYYPSNGDVPNIGTGFGRTYGTANRYIGLPIRPVRHKK